MAIAEKNVNTYGVRSSQPVGNAPRAFSVEEFSRRYRIGRTKVYEELKLGRLRARKIGRRTIIPADDAESWLHGLPHMKTTNRQGGGAS